MKKYSLLLILSVLLLSPLTSTAQSPDATSLPPAFGYQAVVHDDLQQLVPNRTVAVRISIFASTPYSQPLFQEIHFPQTNSAGLFFITVGQGQNISGDINDIDWSVHPCFLRTEVDPNGGSDFSQVSTQPIPSVPFAFIAASTNQASSLNGFTPLRSDTRVTALSKDLDSLESEVAHLQNKNAPSPSDFASGGKINFSVGDVSFDMVLVKAEPFSITDSAEYYFDNSPVHSQTLSNDYFIATTELTEALWSAVTSDPCDPAKKDLPHIFSSARDISLFLAKLNRLTGRQFRLPTEVEWIFAARGGKLSHGYLYSGSNNIDDVAWYSGNSNGQLHNVATKAPNELGLYDMSGNADEYFQTYINWYFDNIKYPRGGNCNEPASFCRSNYQWWELRYSYHAKTAIRLTLSR